MTPRPASAGRRLIVHAGPPKTGSTSFHHYLKRNHELLEPHLVVPNELTGVPMSPLGRASIQFSLDPVPEAEAELRRAFADILTALPRGDLPVLLTHENLAGAMPGNAGEVRLFPMLPRIARVLLDEGDGFDMHFVLYTREKQSWLESVWAQAVFTDGYPDTLPDFLDETSGIADWGDLARRLADAVGPDRVTLLRLEDEAELLRPGQALLRIVGLDQSLLDQMHPLERPAMRRLNAGALEFLRRLNAVPLNPHARDKVVRLVASCQPLFSADLRPQGNLS